MSRRSVARENRDSGISPAQVSAPRPRNKRKLSSDTSLDGYNSDNGVEFPDSPESSTGAASGMQSLHNHSGVPDQMY